MQVMKLEKPLTLISIFLPCTTTVLRCVPLGTGASQLSTGDTTIPKRRVKALSPLADLEILWDLVERVGMWEHHDQKLVKIKFVKFCQQKGAHTVGWSNKNCGVLYLHIKKITSITLFL